jgi:glycosyltransferase involved in cell wall biosynthesis
MAKKVVNDRTAQRVAIVCDWLTEVGGGEKVILAVHEMFPEAPIYTSQYRPKRATWFDDCEVRTGWLNWVPQWARRFTPFLRQWYFNRLDLSDYDLVISVTGAEAKSVKTVGKHGKAIHICYCHAPTQYYWSLYDQYMDNPGFGKFLNPIVRLALKLLVRPLRRSDYRAAQRPDYFVANSSYVAGEIKKFYGRDSTLIWPGVDVDAVGRIKKTLPTGKRQGFIISGRQVSWKRVDLAIGACIKLNKQLLVVGDGPEHTQLVEQARGHDNIRFLPRYNGVGEIVGHFAGAKAFLFPSLEPFGIVPVEALAAGTPVVALCKGGALDFVRDGKNGVFFDEQTVDSLAEAIRRIDTMSFDASSVSRSAEKFSEDNFKKQLYDLVQKASNESAK